MGGLVLVVGILASFFSWVGRDDQPLGADLCPRDKNVRIPKVIVVLFDQTDQLTELHQKALQSWFRRLRYREFESEAAQMRSRYSRLELYSYKAKSNHGGVEIAREMVLCNPGNVDELTKFHKNPGQVRRNFESKFLSKIDGEIGKLLSFRESPQSPLLEAIKHVSLDTFADLRFERSAKLLVIVSDMLHNTKDLSMYRGAYSYQTFRRSSYGTRILPNLRGVEVKMLVLTTPSIKLQGTAFLRFWREYFVTAGVLPDALSAARIP